MRYNKFLFFLILAALVSFTACKKDEFSEEVQEEENIEPEITTNNNLVYRMSASSSSTDGLDLECFTITFPFALIVDGEVVVIESEEDFESLDENAEYIDFQYPLNIISEEGEASVVENGEQLGEAFASCIPDGGWEYDEFPAFLICDINSCYQLTYPVDLVDLEENEYTADSEEAFIELIVENPELFFVFPIELVDEEGELVSAENDEELFDILFSCDPIYEPFDTTFGGVGEFGCYDIQFPMIVIDLDGNEISVADENEFVATLFDGDFTGFGFPLNLIDEEGEVIEVTNEEELNEALFDCGFVVELIDIGALFAGSTVMGEDCYSLVYPVSGYNNDGDTITIASDEEALEYLNNPQGFYFIDFPVSVVIIETGETEEIEDASDLFEVFEDCQ